MNLINDKWIPAIRQDGSIEKVAPWQVAEQNNPVIEIDAPRADFQGALYQFLIGLLQTFMPPEDIEDWQAIWEQGIEPGIFKDKLEQYQQAFELKADINTPAFMQDLELADGEVKPISALLIEAPGAKTVKDNLDHFIKRNTFDCLCASCTATALFTLQLNAPSGGVGHRVGLRGGGPLTTLVMPSDNQTPLWQKLWLNILPEDTEEFSYPTNLTSAQVLPWLSPTKLSEKKNTELTPENTNILQQYWAMPRRIRLTTAVEAECCDLCGNKDDSFYMEFRTKNYGCNYGDGWLHVLTPYKFDPKKKKPPLSLKGQKCGLNYSNWLGLTMQDEELGDRCAKVVSHFVSHKAKAIGSGRVARLWCAGFDMDNMKARCWYEHQMPIFNLGEKLTEQQLTFLLQQLKVFVSASRNSAKLLVKHVKEAWFERPKDAKGDLAYLERTFWQHTEQAFFQLLNKISNQDLQQPFEPQISLFWLNTLRQKLDQLFDEMALAAPQAQDLKRAVQAKKSMHISFYKDSVIKKELKPRADLARKEVKA